MLLVLLFFFYNSDRVQGNCFESILSFLLKYINQNRYLLCPHTGYSGVPVSSLVKYCQLQLVPVLQYLGRGCCIQNSKNPGILKCVN